MAIHLGKKYSTYDVKVILHEATQTLDHFPSIAETEKIAEKLGVTNSQDWKYFEESDCFVCGGLGWHYVLRSDGGKAVVACDDCRAGKNLQRAPKGILRHTAKDTKETTYHAPGRGFSRKETHLAIIEQYGSLEAMADALETSEPGEIAKAWLRHFNAVKRVPMNNDNPNFDRKLEELL